MQNTSFLLDNLKICRKYLVSSSIEYDKAKSNLYSCQLMIANHDYQNVCAVGVIFGNNNYVSIKDTWDVNITRKNNKLIIEVREQPVEIKIYNLGWGG